MKIRSLRLRLALLSALLSGVVLGAFGVIFWGILWRANLDRLDSELRSQLLQAVAALHPRIDWSQFDQRIQQRLEQAGLRNVIVWVGGAMGETLYQSKFWSKSISPEQLAFPQVLPPAAMTLPSNRASGGLSRNSEDPGVRPLPPVSQFQNGRVVFPRELPPRSSPMLSPQDAFFPPPEEAFSPPRVQPKIKLQTLHRDGEYWRMGLVVTPHNQLAIGVNLKSVDLQMFPVRTAFLMAFPVALLPIAASAWLLSNRALRPVRHLTNAVKGVTATGLDRRLNVAGEDLEFQSLVLVFNQMMERLERSFHHARRFSADAAHELKTPLAILQGEIERSLQRLDTDPVTQKTLTNLLEETQRLKSIVRKLLLLSLADAGRLPLHPERFDFSTAIEESVDDICMLASHLTIDADIPPHLEVMGDPILLRQVVQNLTSNAIKYNLPEGYIRIQLGRDAQWIWLQISNPSALLSKEDQKRLFERFYRASLSRDRAVEGLGLGLSLSREIARAHGGDIVCTQSAMGKVCFTLSLPRKTFDR